MSPIVKLFRNPWSKTLSDGVLLGILHSAAIEANEKLKLMIAAGLVEDGRDSFGAVLLDPTRPRSAVSLKDRVLATIEIGPNGKKYIPNGAAKADAHDRHGFLNGALVADASHCLGNDDFAWGNSAEYDLAIGGGSGLSVKQDGEMVEMILKGVIDTVRTYRDDWIRERRQGDGHQAWYNPADAPGYEYAEIANMEPFLSPVS